ncbi:MAG: three-Cys-motif partner protein TcmP [Ignavibacteria bacterium]|nr:three-Cys-motif partner protein TcmP [Ignavibacteria bacterium]
MAIPKEVVWEIDPHTIAKHKILKAYLDAWYPILKSTSSRLNYIDGFSGPGKYLGSELGSPLVVIDLALKHQSLNGVELNFIFVEENLARKENLEKEISVLKLPDHFKIGIVHGEFHEVIGKILDELERSGENLAPTFVFIDPFGFAGIPFSIIERLMKIPRVEVLITFMVNRINQFIGDRKNNQHIINLFGSEKVLEMLDENRGNRYEVLRAFYQKQLHNVAGAKFVRYFGMKDVNDRPIYDLFFATKHPLGHIKMKEAMWNIDNEGLFQFSDGTDQNQIVLFQPDSRKVLFDIINETRTKQRYEVKRIRKFVEDETAFLERHMKKSLEYAEENKFIDVDLIKSNGQKRRGKTFPDDVIINFK